MFDYIIIGAGSAGGVLANRLSESGADTVCLLEAGPRAKSPLITMPVGFALTIQDFKCNIYNWRFNTRPDKSMANRSQYQPRGKGLGGSSSTNGMVYTRGHETDYDAWEALGNEGWGYKDLLPYFRKAEDNERGANEYHGAGGPIKVTDARTEFGTVTAFLRSCLELGIPFSSDFNNAAGYEGAGFYQVTASDGKRSSVATGYIYPAETRPNLTVETGAHVNRILFEGKRAVGVEFLQNGRKRTVKANKEVILSGGAFNSPQILMLSGVGPKDELAKHDIDAVHELPGVGKNLQEHPDVMLVYRGKQQIGVSLGGMGIFKIISGLLQYVFTKAGWMASPPATAGGFFKTSAEEPLPDFQLHFTPMVYRDHARDWGLLFKWGFSILVNVARPKSRGEVTLKSSDPSDHPDIQLRLLDDEYDVECLKNAIKKTREITAQHPFEQYIAEEIDPGPSTQTDAEIIEFMREKGSHAYHPVGSCKMGQDHMAVVDERLRVRGVQGLRVVDASIMPLLIGSNTNAPVIMIGEKAADMIREDNATRTGGRKEKTESTKQEPVID